jgi:hypothetical protein
MARTHPHTGETDRETASSRLLSLDARGVTFRTRGTETVTLDAERFIERCWWRVVPSCPEAARRRLGWRIPTGSRPSPNGAARQSAVGYPQPVPLAAFGAPGCRTPAPDTLTVTACSGGACGSAIPASVVTSPAHGKLAPAVVPATDGEASALDRPGVFERRNRHRQTLNRDQPAMEAERARRLQDANCR